MREEQVSDYKYIILLEEVFSSWCKAQPAHHTRYPTLTRAMIAEFGKLLTGIVEIKWLDDDNDWPHEFLIFENEDDYNLIRLTYL